MTSLAQSAAHTPLVERLRHSAERLSARRTGQLSATSNYGNAGRGHCDPCLEPAVAACSEAADAIAELLEALEACVANSDEYMLSRLDQPILANARAALAKARGQ